MPNPDKKLKEKKTLELLHQAMKQDNELRQKYEIGDKFRFIRERLQTLITQLEEDIQKTEEVEKEETREVISDEILVYVYLFNAHGMNLSSWQNMLIPKVLYEYSVNRPIYTDKAHVNALLRSKTDKQQHAYLTIAVKRNDVVTLPNSVSDAIGNPLVKVREGSLRFDRVILFTHNGHDYTVDEKGSITKVEGNNSTS